MMQETMRKMTDGGCRLIGWGALTMPFLAALLYIEDDSLSERKFLLLGFFAMSFCAIPIAGPAFRRLWQIATNGKNNFSWVHFATICAILVWLISWRISWTLSTPLPVDRFPIKYLIAPSVVIVGCSIVGLAPFLWRPR